MSRQRNETVSVMCDEGDRNDLPASLASARLPRHGAEARQAGVVRPTRGFGPSETLALGQFVVGVDYPLERVAERGTSALRGLARIPRGM